MNGCTGVVILAVLAALAAVVPWRGIAFAPFNLTVEPAIVLLTSLWPVDGALLVVVAEWVTAADFLLAVCIVGRAVRGLNPVACVCIVVAVTSWYVVFAALVCGDAEVSTPAIGALNITFAAALRVRAWLVGWHAEWAIWTEALLHVVRAVLHVWAWLTGRRAEWAVWARAVLLIWGALWRLDAGKVAEASALDVTILTTVALLI